MMRIDKILAGAILLICFYFHSNYWRSIWMDKWFFTMLALSGFAAWSIARRYHASVGALVFVLLADGLWAFAWPGSYTMLDMNSLLAVKEVGAYTFAAVMTFSFTCWLMEYETFESLATVFGVLCLLNSLYIVGQALHGTIAQARGGFFGNPSMSGCLIAFTYPFMMFKSTGKSNGVRAISRIGMALTAALAMLLTGSSQPIMVFTLVFIAYMWAAERKTFTWYQLVSLSIPLFIFSGVALLFFTYRPHEGIFDTSGRYGVWKLCLTWWWQNGHRMTGEGTGLSHILIPFIQQANLGPVHDGQMIDWWLWFHSDWLQLLFENGITGLLAGIIMYGFALIKSWAKEPWLFSAVVGVGATALFNFPTHFPIHAVICVTVLTMTFDKNYLALNRIHCSNL